MLDQWFDAGLLRPIDSARILAFDSLFPHRREIDALNRGEMVHAVPFAWGNSSVLFRTDLAADYVDNPTWSILWDQEHVGRLSQRDSMDAAVPTAALMLGIHEPYTMSDSDLARVREHLIAQKDVLRDYWSSLYGIQQSLATGELVAAYAWNDSLAALRQREIEVDFMIPREGILTWVAPELLVDLSMADPRHVLNACFVFAARDPDLRVKAQWMFHEVKSAF